MLTLFFLDFLLNLHFLLFLVVPFLLNFRPTFRFTLSPTFLTTPPLFPSLIFDKGKPEILMKALDIFASNINLALRGSHQMQVHLQFLLIDGCFPTFILQNLSSDDILKLTAQRYLLFYEFNKRVDGQLVLLYVYFDGLVEALLFFGGGHCNDCKSIL